MDRTFREELADLLDALLECRSGDDAHDLIVNYTAAFEDAIQRLRA